jgi:hypothetical protein
VDVYRDVQFQGLLVEGETCFVVRIEAGGWVHFQTLEPELLDRPLINLEGVGPPGIDPCNGIKAARKSFLQLTVVFHHLFGRCP